MSNFDFGTVMLAGSVIKPCENEKYLGHIISKDNRDDLDILRQVGIYYSRANKLCRKFHYCTNAVKTRLFNSYCNSFYCMPTWRHFHNYNLNKLKVAHNKSMRKFFNYQFDHSARDISVVHKLMYFDVIYRKSIHSLNIRTLNNENLLCKTVIESDAFFTSNVRNTWRKILYN